MYTVCPWHIWDDLPWWERSAAVAHYRTHLLIDMHVQAAYEHAAKMNSQQGQR